MMRFLGIVGFLLMLSTALVGCAPPEDEAHPDKFGVMTESYMPRSLLRSISPLVRLDAAGSIDVCVMLAGAAAAPSDYEARIRRSVEAAASDWNELLNQPPPFNDEGTGFPPWVRETVTVNFTCSGDRLYYVYGDTSNPRAYADVVNRTVRLDTSCTWDDGRLRAVMTHEYGHLLGLSDTYVEPEIGLDVYGQPPSVMQSATGFTADDQAGVWNLWRYLEQGGDPCGPGYDLQAVNTRGTYCILTEDDAAGSSGDADGACAIRCSDYDVSPGQCFPDASGAYWECDDLGCLERVHSCSDDSDSAQCDISCSWYDLSPGDCAVDTNDNFYECNALGCLEPVDACGGSPDDDDSETPDCDYACVDWGVSPGECFTDRGDNSWECDADGCLGWVESCGDVDCEYDCSLLRLSPGQCTVDARGNSWSCDADACLQWVSSCS